MTENHISSRGIQLWCDYLSSSSGYMVFCHCMWGRSGFTKSICL